MERFSELCTIWTETVKFALDDLKEVRNHFEVCFLITDFILGTYLISSMYLVFLSLLVLVAVKKNENKLLKC